MRKNLQSVLHRRWLNLFVCFSICNVILYTSSIHEKQTSHNATQMIIQVYNLFEVSCPLHKLLHTETNSKNAPWFNARCTLTQLMELTKKCFLKMFHVLFNARCTLIQFMELTKKCMLIIHRKELFLEKGLHPFLSQNLCSTCSSSHFKCTTPPNVCTYF